MSERLSIAVRSNVEALSATVVHEALIRMIDHSLEGSEAFLRADRAGHSRTGATEAAIHRDHVKDAVEVAEGKLGVGPVIPVHDRPTHGRYRHSQAPIFTDEGTRSPIFAATPGGLMTNRSEGIFRRREVRGQRGQHFMAKTYGELQALLHADPSLRIAMDAMAAEASALIPIAER